ncbi:MAG: hypothetical protein K4304_06475 [Propionicimonas sp.]
MAHTERSAVSGAAAARPRRFAGWHWPLVVGLAVIPLLAGCAAQGGQPNPQVVPSRAKQEKKLLSFSELVDQYKSARSDFELPSGYEYPGFPSGYDESGSYEDGYGRSMVFGYYECTWEIEWLETRNDHSQRGKKALQVLLAMPETDVFKKSFDPGLQQHMKEYFEMAALGDPSGIQSTVAANCDDVKKAR